MALVPVKLPDVMPPPPPIGRKAHRLLLSQKCEYIAAKLRYAKRGVRGNIVKANGSTGQGRVLGDGRAALPEADSSAAAHKDEKKMFRLSPGTASDGWSLPQAMNGGSLRAFFIGCVWLLSISGSIVFVV